MPGLTKTQLIRQLAEKTELTNKQSAAFLEHLADTAIKETKKNGIFVVPGLGRLKKVHRKARTGRNPQTGAPVKIAASKAVRFAPAAAFKAALNTRTTKKAAATKAAPAKKAAATKAAPAKKAPFMTTLP